MARTTGSIGEKTSKELLHVALKLFSEHGYSAVSMRQIAAATGIQAGAIYNHFPTKQTLLFTVMRDHLQSLLIEVESHGPSQSSALEQLEAFVRFHIRYHIDKADAVFVAYMELRSLDDDNFKTIQALRQRYERILREILRRGQSEGVLQIDDTPVAAMAIIAMLTGVNTWYRYGGRLSVSEIESIYVKMAMASVGANPATQQSMEAFA